MLPEASGAVLKSRTQEEESDDDTPSSFMDSITWSPSGKSATFSLQQTSIVLNSHDENSNYNYEVDWWWSVIVTIFCIMRFNHK